MTCYEKLNLLFNFINICVVIYVSYIFQKKFSDDNQIKEILNSELLKIETIVEKLFYAEKYRNEYLINKRRVSNILYCLSQPKNSKFFKLGDISDLKHEFEKLTFSLEAKDGECEKYKTNIFNKILNIRSSIYNF